MDAENRLFPEKVTEDEFFADLERGKILVDNGITDYFILLNPRSFKNVSNIGNTTLKDIVSVFGESYIRVFRFAGFFDCGSNGALKDEYMSFSIRPITKSDKARLRESVTYFPKDTWVCDWRDGNRNQLIVPFIQDDITAEILWLHQDRAYIPKSAVSGRSTKDFNIPPEVIIKPFIEQAPDYFDCNLAICKYKGCDIAIPLASGTAKTTFKNREKDETGVKRHIVHTVKDHDRINAENKVERHLRGSSDIVIRDEKITICAPLEWSNEIYIRKQLAKAQRGKKRR